MTVLSAVQAAAPWIGISVPTVLFSATDRTSVEMQHITNECAKAIAEDYDWQRLRTLATITGDGTDTSFPLPTDYARMLKKASLWPSAQPNTPMLHIVDTDRWLQEEVQNYQTVTNRWTLYGNEIRIKPAMANLATAKYFYISKYLVVATGGSAPTKTDFTLDTDELFVDERLLKLSIIWRWKAAKGRPYAEDLENYTRALDTVTGNDKGARILHIGKRRVPSDVNLAWPGRITP